MKYKNTYLDFLPQIGLWLYTILSACIYGTFDNFIFWMWALLGTICCVIVLFGNFLGMPGKYDSKEEREMLRQADREGKILWFRKMTVTAFLAGFGWIGVVLQDKLSVEAGPIS